MGETPSQPETISKLLDAVYPSFALLAGMELDLFTPLRDGPLTAEELAAALDVHPVKLRPLLYALVVSGMLLVENDQFSNSSEAGHYLVRGEPAYLGQVQGLTANNWNRLLKIAQTIRAGGPVDQDDYHSMSQEELSTLLRGLHPYAVADAEMLMEQHDLSTYRSLLDVGGGSGGLAITIAQANPRLKATIVDLPRVTPITRQFAEEAGAGKRIEVLTADAVQETLTGSYDVIVARHVTQVLSAEDCRALLKNLASVHEPNGAIYLVGWVLDDSRVSPRRMVENNLVLLTAYEDGQAYAEQEYRDWLAEAGYVDFERVIRRDGASILAARKPR
jgi:ubiquinone/menaquinone biosynthesis C-methylase UbiE